MWFIISTSIAAFMAYVSYQLFFHPLANVPGPFLAKFTKLWGFYQTFQWRRHLLDMELHAKYGSIVRVAPNTVIFSNSKYLHDVYGVSRAFPKSAWYQAAASGMPFDLDMLVETNADKLRLQKRLIGPTYSTASVRKYDDLTNQDITALEGRLKASNGNAVDIQRFLEFFAIDALSRVTYGEAVGAQKADTDWGHMSSVNDFWQHVTWVGTYTWLIKLDWALKLAKQLNLFTPSGSRSRIFQFCGNKIGEISKAGPDMIDQPCIYGSMLHLSKTNPKFKASWGTAMSITDLGAGIDTSTWTMATVLRDIATHPKVKQAVYEEIQTAVTNGTIELKGQPITYDKAVNSLPYLQACMEESMRLFPNVSLPLFRVVPPWETKGLTVDGHNLPPGTELGINSWVQGRDKATFGDDADEYRPERWLKATKLERQVMKRGDLSFGSPARICPGRYLAWFIMSKTLSTILRDFDVTVLNSLNGEPGPGGRVWREEASFIMKMIGLEISFTAR